MASKTVKVTNKHFAPLGIGNQSVRPGATVELNREVYEAWAQRPVAAAWLKDGLIVEGNGDGTYNEEPQPDLTTVTTGRTGGLGLKPGEEPQGSNAALEDAAGNGGLDPDNKSVKLDKKGKFARARELGLNPNNNTSEAKLDEMIANAEGK